MKPILSDENMKIVDQLLNTEEEDIDSPSTIEIVPYESLSRPDNNSICLFSVISHLLKSSKKSSERSWKTDEIFMRNCRELAKFDSVLLLPILSSLFEKLCYLCNSLRSLVVREAIMTVEELFLSLKVDPCFLLRVERLSYSWKGGDRRHSLEIDERQTISSRRVSSVS